MVILHPDSRPLTCMSIDIGRFQWTQLPMGTVVPSYVFPEKTRWNIPQYPRNHWNCWWYGHLWEMNQGTWQTFPELPTSIVRMNNLTLNALKLQFHLGEESFFGHNWEFQGNITGSQKIQAIQQMDILPDKELMQCFLGMVNFLNRYSPTLVELSTSFRQLCRLHADHKP